MRPELDRRRLWRLPLLFSQQWRRRLGFWLGAALVGLLVAVGFAWLTDAAQGAFLHLAQAAPLLVFLIAPAGLALSLVLTRRWFPGAQGSGIPQVIAALHEADPGRTGALLTLRIAAGQVLLTLLGLLSGAAIMHAIAGGSACRTRT